MLKELSRSMTQRNRIKSTNKSIMKNSNKNTTSNTMNNLLTRESSTQNTNNTHGQMYYNDKINKSINTPLKNYSNSKNKQVGKLFKRNYPRKENKSFNLNNKSQNYYIINDNFKNLSEINSNFNSNIISNVTSNINSNISTNLNSIYNSNNTLKNINNEMSLKKKKRPQTPNLKSNFSYYQSFKNVKKNNMKSFLNSIDQSIPINIDKSYNYELVNNEMNNLEEMINSIKNKGFEKYQKEMNAKIQEKEKLEN